MNNTPRKSITKVKDMTRKDLLAFLEDCEHQINLLDEKYDTTIKIDGQSFRLGVTKDKVFYESSYSGVQENAEFFDDERLNRAFSIIEKEHLSNWLIDVREQVGYNFKLVGEVLCPLENEKETFTPVVTTFSLEKFKKNWLASPYYERKVAFIVTTILDENGNAVSDEEFERIMQYIINGFWCDFTKKFRKSDAAYATFIAILTYEECSIDSKKKGFNLDEIKELFSDFNKNWKEIREYLNQKIQESLRKNMTTPFATDDAIQEGVVFKFNNKLFAVTFDEWREAHKKLTENNPKYSRGRREQRSEHDSGQHSSTKVVC